MLAGAREPGADLGRAGFRATSLIWIAVDLTAPPEARSVPVAYQPDTRVIVMAFCS